jgi:signal transduction histidine kinase
VHTEFLKLRPFVIDVASGVESLVNERRLAFSIAVPSTLPRIATDPAHLRQILVNLLGNAIKFTSDGGITVRAALVADGDVASFAASAPMRPLLTVGGSWVALQVTDTGAGIAAKDLERIFEEFEQVNAGPRGDSMRRGTGLGLAISRRLARLLGGDITVESVEGKGSAFTVWLPAEGSGHR